MTNEQTARIVVDFDTDERCIGCGDYLSYCDSVDCLAIVGRHESGDHGLCDILACDDIRWQLEGPPDEVHCDGCGNQYGLCECQVDEDSFYSVYIPSHKLGRCRCDN